MTLNTKTKNILIIVIPLLAIAVVVYFWQQGVTQKPDTLIPSPFSQLEYPAAQFSDQKVNIALGSTLPQRANTYTATPQLPPLLTEENGIEQLKQTLQIQDTDQQMAPAEEIFWYNNSRYLSYNQTTNSLSFTLNIRALENLPEKGGCFSSNEAVLFTEDFLSESKLLSSQDNLSGEFTTGSEELTAVGLLPTSDAANCQVVMVAYRPQLNQRPLLSSLDNNFVRVLKVKGQNQVAGFYVANQRFEESLTDAPLKDLSEIKKALEEDKGVYFKKCSSGSNNATIDLKAPELVYFANHQLGQAQPVFRLTRKVTEACEEVVLVRGVKEEWYE